jgi:hypothetical protein
MAQKPLPFDKGVNEFQNIIMRNKYFSALLVLVSSVCWALDPDGVSRPNFQKGKVVKLEYSNGRTADLMLSAPVDMEIPVTLQVEENTCEPDRIGQICKYLAHVRKRKFELHWVRHPDPNQLGKPVKRKKDDVGGEDVFHYSVWYSFHRDKYPEYVKGLPPDVLTCNDFNWLPGSSTLKVNQKYLIRQWLSQFMTLNLETGDSENAFHSGMDQVTLTKKDAKTFQISRVERLFAQGRFLIPLINMVTLVVPKKQNGKNKESCQISLKPDEIYIMRQIGIEGGGEFNKFKPYVFGRDLNLANTYNAFRLFENEEKRIE